MISGEKVRFDQNVPEKNIVTLPNRNERFKLQWQQVQLVPYKSSDTLADPGRLMVTAVRCWCQNHYIGRFCNVKNRSSTSESCQQHKPCPTSVTTVGVAPNSAQITLNSNPISFLGLPNEYKSAAWYS